MINFKEEIKKYGQMLEMDEIEEAIQTTELKDIMDMLGYIAKNCDNTVKDKWKIKRNWGTDNDMSKLRK